MRRILSLAGLAATLVAASPAAADFTDIQTYSFCSGTSLNVCLDMALQRDGATNNYLLIIDYTSSEGDPEGVLTAAGLYQTGTGTGINITDAAIVSASEGNWSIGTQGLEGGGSNIFVVGANAQGNNGISVGGQVVVSFTSTNISEHLATLFARGHIQAFGENGCSLKPDSQLGVVDGVETVDARCGTSTVPEPISMVLLGSGLLGLGGVGLRRRKTSQS